MKYLIILSLLLFGCTEKKECENGLPKCKSEFLFGYGSMTCVDKDLKITVRRYRKVYKEHWGKFKPKEVPEGATMVSIEGEIYWTWIKGEDK